ncbi:MAG: hypothetical protein IH600_02925 [Bacteroidetes bacterium]|nr:hypothetical protein [Bacteroidota bacterium]
MTESDKNIHAEAMMTKIKAMRISGRSRSTPFSSASAKVQHCREIAFHERQTNGLFPMNLPNSTHRSKDGGQKLLSAFCTDPVIGAHSRSDYSLLTMRPLLIILRYQLET